MRRLTPCGQRRLVRPNPAGPKTKAAGQAARSPFVNKPISSDEIEWLESGHSLRRNAVPHTGLEAEFQAARYSTN